MLGYLYQRLKSNDYFLQRVSVRIHADQSAADQSAGAKLFGEHRASRTGTASAEQDVAA